jgi:RNA polymerase sigma-70 factor (ECF subfamily)
MGLEDRERFTELLRVHHTQLFGYLYAMVHDLNDVEDLYQQTAALLWRKFGEYQEGTSFFHWARSIARYEMLNFLRQRKRWKHLAFDAEVEGTLSEVFGEVEPDLLQARLEALRECKERLEKEDARLVEACYGSQRSFRETADRLGRSPKSVYDALRRIRIGLMKCIDARLAEKANRERRP